MTNIWGFLVQTLAVSLVAGLLLAVKTLLADKLSPRWQYGVWSILALRILLPVSMARAVFLPIPLWVETWKAMAEGALHSAYTAVYTVISLRGPIPLLPGPPRSLTDWLFVLYTAGVLAVLLWYLAAYLRLRLLLRRGAPVSAAQQARILRVCEVYSLRPCRAVTVAGLPSAFVCGILRPVLVLPAAGETDDKILLHELLHLRHRDALQSVLWCLLRALHWCNPFLHYVFNRIGNDMEALCDQRVLERLEGEERRAYGGILLSMVNERYPRAPGTTSLSNGGKNISRRLTSIVRFKKYPRGMALVSVCVAVVLALPALAGTAAEYPPDDYRPAGAQALPRAMALARLQRCTTVAGALDTYAKGLMYENGVYIAMASPLEEHEDLAARMRHHAQREGWHPYHLDAGAEFTQLAREDGYYVYNLKLQADGGYTAFLAFQVTGVLAGEAQNPPEEGGEAAYFGGAILLPVSLRQEEGWVVREIGARQLLPGTTAYGLRDTAYLSPGRYQAVGACGTVSMAIHTSYTVANTPAGGGFFVSGTAFDETVNPHAQFHDSIAHVSIEYLFGGSEAQRGALTHVAMEAVPLNAPGEAPVFPGDLRPGDVSWSSSDGTGGTGRQVTPDWDGSLLSGSGGSVMLKDGQPEVPAGYAIRIYWNGEPVEDFVLGEVG